MKIPLVCLTHILHDCLDVRKRAHWVPHNLSDEQKRGRVKVKVKVKRGRVDWCTHMLRKFGGGRSPRVWDIVTGDETCIYQYSPETKQQSAVWIFPDENPPVKFKRNKSASKQMIACFFAKLGHVATYLLEDRKTVMTDLYVNHCLLKVFQAWCKRHPRRGVHGLLLHHDNAIAHTAAVTLDFLAAGHPPTIFTWLSLLWLVFVPFHQKAAEGKAVLGRWICPSILQGRHFGHSPVNVGGCHRQLVWEDGQVCTGWEGFLRKSGVDCVVVSVVEKPDCKT